jgi:1-phosphofructokinase family hexose kinase
MSNISTLTLNPALDKTYFISGTLTPGAAYKIEKPLVNAGGKGINVSRALKKFGIESNAYFPVGGVAGRTLKSLLTTETINYYTVEMKSETRTNIKIIDANGSYTELNETGGLITKKEIDKLIKLILFNSKETPELFIISGSNPNGVDADVFKAVINKIKSYGKRVVLDCSGEALLAGASCKPFLIKSNAAELSELVATEITTISEAVENCAAYFSKTGINIICTVGPKGAVYACEYGVFTVTAPPVKTLRGLAGAGDTFLAAFIYALDESAGNIISALSFASAAAAAKVATDGTGMPELEAVRAVLADENSEICVERI